MRVALFGGSFDPPHRGHVALARLAAERLHLDRVLVAPVGSQPFKQDAAAATFEERTAMVRIAFAAEPKMEVSSTDAPRLDGRPNYTIDAVLSLRRSLDAGDEIFCLMGADSWLTIGKWHRAPELLFACDFIVGGRPGFSLERFAEALPTGIAVTNEQSDAIACVLLRLSAAAVNRSRLYLLPDLAEDASATEVRAALSRQSGLESVLDPGVANYIREHQLYMS